MSAERAFIDALRPFATHPAARGLADDCAVLELGGETLVLTHDMMAEGTHWLPGTDEADIAHKLVASNLSDLAAMGAEPIGALCGFVLDDADYNRGFAQGLGDALALWNVPLLGGDTIAGSARMAGLTLIGRATHVPVPSRSGARPGDGIYLCGTIGEAMFGYNVLKGADAPIDAELRSHFITRFLRPEPLLAEGRALAPHVSAMMDVSDGLLLDGQRMAKASGVTLALDCETMPFSDQFEATLGAMTSGPVTREAALRWGDDYALLFTAPPGTSLPIAASRIGTVLPAGEHHLLLDGVPPPSNDKLGFEHG